MEGVEGLGAGGAVAGCGEVPEEVDFGGAEVEGFAAFGLAEEAGGGVDFEGGGRVVEVDGEGLRGGGLAPRHCDHQLLLVGEKGFVETCDAVLS